MPGISGGEFDGAGMEPGVQVWRVEKMVPTPVPKKMYGQFFDGDAYIVLKTTQRPSSSAFDMDIFFWLGDDCSQDEQGVAAYKTVELDEGLGGGPVQHRECQGVESDKFMQCFKSVQYQKGGCASGFKHVERGVYENRLLHLKGARAVRVSTVPLSAASLNSGDVFILDLGLTLIQWNGSEANKKEKAKALDVCVGIKDDERGGKAKMVVLNQGSETPEFWEALGGQGSVAAATADSTDGPAKGEVKLIKVSDASGKLETTEVATGSLTRDMLDTNDCFIMDNVAEIFVWIGKGATADERKNGMKLGTTYCTEGGRPKGTKVAKVMEGAEPTTFKSNFTSWKAANALMPGQMASPSGNVAKMAKQESADEMVAGLATARREKESMVDDGSGTIDCWRIEDFQPVKVDESLEGQFYAGDSYVIKYTYMDGSKEAYIIYFWLGAQSSQDEKGAAALIATKFDDDTGGAATQVRVVQGKEPMHMVCCFHGRMVIHSGGKASGFKNKADADSYDTDGISLFHIKGTEKNDTRAVQVAEKAASLNSADTFVLQTPSTIFAWKGAGANDSEAAIAHTVAELLQAGRTLEDVAEGSESDAFWDALGGKGEYPSVREGAEPGREPMLFSCSNSTGTLKLEPIFDFAQEDLTEEDVFILDTFTTVFVWVGDEANAAEKKGAKEAAAAYIKANGYDDDTSIVTVKSGNENAMFTCNFLGWNKEEKKKFIDPYEAKLAAAMAANPDDPDVSEAPKNVSAGSSGTAADVADGDYKEPTAHAQDYESLKKPTDQLPSGVDPRKREQYLRDDDFEKVLGSPRAEFNKLKPWKQNQLKKAAGLF